MIKCVTCEGKAEFSTQDELIAHTVAIHGVQLPTDPFVSVSVKQSELYLINRALSVAAAIYTADAMHMSKHQDFTGARACFDTAREMRELCHFLENR